MHSLLARQLKRYFGGPEHVPADLEDFVDAVDDAYVQSDLDRGMLERSLDLSSQELLYVNAELRSLLQSLPHMVYVLDAQGRVLDLRTGTPIAAPASEGQSYAGVGGPSLDGVRAMLAGDQVQGAVKDVVRTWQTVTLEQAAATPDGTRYFEARLLPLPELEDGTVRGVALTLHDVTERKRAEAALRQSEERYRSIVETAHEGILSVDREANVTFVNQTMADMLGYDVRELIGQSFFALLDGPNRQVAETQFQLRKAGAATRYDLRFRRRDGSELWTIVSGAPLYDDDGVFTGALAMVTDISERKRSEQELERLALHDTLTDLPNRTLLMDRMQQAIAASSRYGTALALLLLDLDRFKEVNDTFGHPTGDQLLRQVGARMGAVLRETDTVGRLGGDEFAVLLPDIEGADGAIAAANRVLNAVERPFEVEGLALELGASIGIALYPDHGTDPNSLMQRADVAMYMAKRAGGGAAVYTAEQDLNSPGRLALRAALRRGIEQGELALHYQPQVDVRTGEVVGMEALARWQQPDRGLLLPDEFVPLAELTGLIRPMTRWVLETAVQQARLWQRQGLDFVVSVNLSARDLHNSEFPDLVARLLGRWGVAAHRLQVEITESSIMDDPEQARDVLTRLRAIGVSTALDDFGTGYSSLVYIRRLALDELKIDKSFTRNMAHDHNDTVIVRSTIELAHNLGLRVVAEGVEDQQTLDILAALGCDRAQGYLWSPARDADSLRRWLRRRRAITSRSTTVHGAPAIL